MPKHAPNVPKGTPSDRSDERIGLTEAFSPVGDGAHAGGFSYRGDNDDEYPDAIEALEPVDAPPLLFGDDTVAAEPEEPQGRHGKQKKEKKQKQQIPAYQRKSRRMRRVLIAIVVLLILLIGATAKKTNVPNLAAVLGMTKDEAIAALKHGATETTSKEVNEEGNPVKTNVTVALTDEPADTRSGTPTVYLGLNEDGAVVQAGYSAATASLGYGSLSFVDAVKNEGITKPNTPNTRATALRSSRNRTRSPARSI